MYLEMLMTAIYFWLNNIENLNKISMGKSQILWSPKLILFFRIRFNEFMNNLTDSHILCFAIQVVQGLHYCWH